MIDEKGRFVLENYRKKSVFSGFLPGISGITGIPIWCFYVNRGQGITCFGAEDKEHSIMEFLPAHQAYIQTEKMGYRTFLKVDGRYFEAFTNIKEPHKMFVDQNTLAIEEDNQENHVKTEVTYFTLPEEKIGALVRKVTFTNTSEHERKLSFVDGCPAIIPFGVNLFSMKNMTQTAKAWMQVEDVEMKAPFYRVRASMDDSTKIVSIDGGNFSICVDENNNRLQTIVDTGVIFDFDTAYTTPHQFIEHSVEELLAAKQITMNQIPCSFYAGEVVLQPGKSYTLFEVTGQAANKELYHEFLKKELSVAYFEEKLARAIELTRKITDVIATKTANRAFDEYCRQDLLDNVLRGGMPIHLGKNMFYVYARKHGDMERDYNFFRTLPEFYSQGNGNFRDINQNRRCDAFFFPDVCDKNIRMFYDFIQLDGYNPLGVEKTTFRLSEDKLVCAAEVLSCSVDEIKDLTKPYTPGKLAAMLTAKKEYEEKELTELIGAVTDLSESLVTSDFLEGYWCDHWTYNLDLVENYLAVHPEEEYSLFFENKKFVYMKPGAGVYPRKKRFQETEVGIRQYQAVYPLKDENPEEKLLKDVNGKVIHTTLIEKMILLNTIKFATLDAYGCGMDMEAGKPGWYDALNGLPGILGSSIPETCELARNLEYTIGLLKKYGKEVSLLRELTELIQDVKKVIQDNQVVHGEGYFLIWDGTNTAKEAYREKLYQGVSGEYQTISSNEITAFMEQLLLIVKEGLSYAIETGKGLIPTYYSYEVTDYEKNDEGIIVKSVKQHMLPYFLEGPVRYLKLPLSAQEKQEVYSKVRTCGLYDEKLKMYKVNAPLAAESFELGRCRAFTPGWLENESIWLHMEYKYLLELLKSGMYEEYIEDFHHAVIPFLQEDMYGRSILENSSFLASSANPDEKIHGKGFVARLSGSTVEFMDMWQIMMFGKRPFSQSAEGLTLGLKPVLPAYLLGNEGIIEVTFLGKIKIVYHVTKTNTDYIPGKYTVKEYQILTGKGQVTHVYTEVIKGVLAEEIRAGKVMKIDVFLD